MRPWFESGECQMKAALIERHGAPKSEEDEHENSQVIVMPINLR
jgi:hypothetical protein